MEEINNPSESEQMYLVTIARLGEIVDECPIPISKVAEIMDITPISANQMIHRLEQIGLVTYTPYKGVEFTQTGWQAASKILRIRRLWEVFLAEYLKYTPKEAETLACRLEHAISSDTAERLAEFLAWPQISPQGKPIPQSEIDIPLPIGIPLSRLSAGLEGTVSAILMGEAEKSFLQQAGLIVGTQIEILSSQQNGAYLVKSKDTGPLGLTAELTEKILVEIN